jgi:recombination protein RecT
MAQTQQTETPQLPTIVGLRKDIGALHSQFAMALKMSGIDVDHFSRVLITALQNAPILHDCDRGSVLSAAMHAAQDGLLPDGSEGAIVPFKEDGRRIARWLPMIRGLRRKVLASDEVASWDVYIVRAGDPFEIQHGDDPRVFHKPSLDESAHTRPIIGAYSVAKFKPIGQSIEFMTIGEIEQVRTKSRASKGPWHDKVFYPEMCKKTVARRHAKRLPMSAAVEQIFRRDDALYDLEKREPNGPQQQRVRLESANAMLDHFASSPDQVAPEKPATEVGGPPESDVSRPASPESDQAEASSATETPPIKPSSAAPKNFEQYVALVEATCVAATDAEELKRWFASDAQRRLRNQCNLVAEDTAQCKGIVDTRVKALNG